jgi:hypothetical protein
LELVEDEIIELMEAPEPIKPKIISYDSFEDDLRAGAFTYIRITHPTERPLPYQIMFCDQERTMAWTYPQERVLTLIEACPIPMDIEGFLPSLKGREVNIIITQSSPPPLYSNERCIF